MARKSRRRTFADLVDEPTWSETDRSRSGEHAIRPGTFNHAGQFFDPVGRLLVLREHAVAPAEAVRRVAAGALVAFECEVVVVHGGVDWAGELG